MTLDELTRKAERAYYEEKIIPSRGAIRNAVLAVLAEVKRAMPGASDVRVSDGAYNTAAFGWEMCCDEMLRRLDEMSR